MVPKVALGVMAMMAMNLAVRAVKITAVNMASDNINDDDSMPTCARRCSVLCFWAQEPKYEE